MLQEVLQLTSLFLLLSLLEQEEEAIMEEEQLVQEGVMGMEEEQAIMCPSSQPTGLDME
jgi:hypothetical protein